MATYTVVGVGRIAIRPNWIFVCTTVQVVYLACCYMLLLPLDHSRTHFSPVCSTAGIAAEHFQWWA